MSVIWESASDAALTRPRSIHRPRTTRQQEASSHGAPILSDEEGLRRTFTLLAEDLAVVRTARTARNQLGLALLLAWMRAVRRAVADPATLPAELVAFIAGVTDVSPESLEGYGDRSRRGPRIAHIRSICRYLGLRPLEHWRQPAPRLPPDEGGADRQHDRAG